MDSKQAAEIFGKELEQLCPDIDFVTAEVDFMGLKRHSVRVRYLSNYSHFFTIGRTWVMLKIFPSGEQKTDDLEIREADKKSAQASIIYFLSITAQSMLFETENRESGKLLLNQCRDALYYLSKSPEVPRRQRSHAKFLLSNVGP